MVVMVVVVVAMVVAGMADMVVVDLVVVVVVGMVGVDMAGMVVGPLEDLFTAVGPTNLTPCSLSISSNSSFSHHSLHLHSQCKPQ
jgi:hypothetical protein